MAMLEEFPEEMDASGRKKNIGHTATRPVITEIKATWNYWNYWNYFSNFHLHSCFGSHATNKCYSNVTLSNAHWITTNHLSIEWALVPHLSSGGPVFGMGNLIDEVAGGFKIKPTCLKWWATAARGIAWKLERLSYSMKCLIDLVTELAERGVEPHSMTDGSDTGTPPFTLSRACGFRYNTERTASNTPPESPPPYVLASYAM